MENKFVQERQKHKKFMQKVWKVMSLIKAEAGREPNYEEFKEAFQDCSWRENDLLSGEDFITSCYDNYLNRKLLAKGETPNSLNSKGTRRNKEKETITERNKETENIIQREEKENNENYKSNENNKENENENENNNPSSKENKGENRRIMENKGESLSSQTPCNNEENNANTTLQSSKPKFAWEEVKAKHEHKFVKDDPWDEQRIIDCVHKLQISLSENEYKEIHEHGSIHSQSFVAPYHTLPEEAKKCLHKSVAEKLNLDKENPTEAMQRRFFALLKKGWDSGLKQMNSNLVRLLQENGKVPEAQTYNPTKIESNLIQTFADESSFEMESRVNNDNPYGLCSWQQDLQPNEE